MLPCWRSLPSLSENALDAKPSVVTLQTHYKTIMCCRIVFCQLLLIGCILTPVLRFDGKEYLYAFGCYS